MDSEINRGLLALAVVIFFGIVSYFELKRPLKEFGTAITYLILFLVCCALSLLILYKILSLLII